MICGIVLIEAYYVLFMSNDTYKNIYNPRNCKKKKIFLRLLLVFRYPRVTTKENVDYPFPPLNLNSILTR